MKRLLCALLLLAMLSPRPAVAALWTAERAIYCAENRPNCRLMQMAANGSFERFDPDDKLNGRVLASVYLQLREVGEEDIIHFSREFEVDAGVARDCFYEALRNCLWAYILYEQMPNGKVSMSEKVLLLFIDPTSQADAGFQIARIREEMTEAALEKLAEAVGAPADFVRWLLNE